jgi:hypothetical protein
MDCSVSCQLEAVIEMAGKDAALSLINSLFISNHSKE